MGVKCCCVSFLVPLCLFFFLREFSPLELKAQEKHLKAKIFRNLHILWIVFNVATYLLDCISKNYGLVPNLFCYGNLISETLIVLMYGKQCLPNINDYNIRVHTTIIILLLTISVQLCSLVFDESKNAYCRLLYLFFYSLKNG